MRRWRGGFFVGLGLVGTPTLAVSEPQTSLPQDFLATVHEMDAAYARKDIDGILTNYAPDCTFILVTQSLRETHKVAGYEASYKIVYGRERHDVAWQRQQLQQLFFVTNQPLEKPHALPLQRISVTSSIQKSFVNHPATELRLTVARKIYLHQGQVVGIRPEVDEELWSKGAQGWKLKRRTIASQGETTLTL